MDKVECSCKGNNPSCARCWGTGLYEPQRSEGLPRPTVTVMARAAAQRTKSAPQTISTPSTPAPGPESHRATTSEQRKQSRPAALARFDDGSLTVICGHCAKAVLASRLGKHTQRVHPGASVFPGTTETVSIPSGMVRCTQCLSLMRRNSLARHLRLFCINRVGAGSAAELPLEQPSKTRPECEHEYSANAELSLGAEPVLSPLATEDAALAPTEGSLDLGKSFRDHGQFGSHPNFDSMDDESKS